MVIYLDTGDLEEMRRLETHVSGFTTNPSLMKKSGITRYRDFAHKALEIVGGKPISFEVFADDFNGMDTQAREIRSWGPNVYVKIPVTDTTGEDTCRLCGALGSHGVQLNVTAIMTLPQIRRAARCLYPTTPAIISIFCGRIADTGLSPLPFITEATRVKHDRTKILWASAREILNVKQAEQAGADIITLSPELVRKLSLSGKDLDQYSLETVREFYEDGKGIEF